WMARVPALSFARARTRNWCARRSAMRSMDGRSAKSKDARWCCRLTVASPPSRSSAMIAGNRNLPEGQHQQANPKTCSDRITHSKFQRRLPHRNPVSRKNVDDLESKLWRRLLRHNVTHAEKSSVACKMVLALPHILRRSPYKAHCYR